MPIIDGALHNKENAIQKVIHLFVPIVDSFILNHQNKYLLLNVQSNESHVLYN